MLYRIPSDSIQLLHGSFETRKSNDASQVDIDQRCLGLMTPVATKLIHR